MRLERGAHTTLLPTAIFHSLQDKTVCIRGKRSRSWRSKNGVGATGQTNESNVPQAWLQAPPDRPIQPPVHAEPSCPLDSPHLPLAAPVALSGKGVSPSPPSAETADWSSKSESKASPGFTDH
uniref:Uncharacterized protein n=1 Tax=Arundo donax TaxID=35708 RepID=A0A0A8Z1W3_ARUDO